MSTEALLISANNNVELPHEAKIHLVYMIYTYHPTLLGKVFYWQSEGCQQNLTFCVEKGVFVVSQGLPRFCGNHPLTPK